MTKRKHAKSKTQKKARQKFDQNPIKPFIQNHVIDSVANVILSYLPLKWCIKCQKLVSTVFSCLHCRVQKLEAFRCTYTFHGKVNLITEEYENDEDQQMIKEMKREDLVYNNHLLGMQSYIQKGLRCKIELVDHEEMSWTDHKWFTLPAITNDQYYVLRARIL